MSTRTYLLVVTALAVVTVLVGLLLAGALGLTD